MSRGNEALLEAQALSKHFGGTTALKEVSFSAGAGEILGLIGPNGAGKTTLLNLLSGVMRPSSGRVLFAGHDLSRLRTHAVARMGIARTLQTPRSFPSMSVLENVAVGALFGRRDPHPEAALESLERRQYLAAAIVQGELQVLGTHKADSIRLYVDPRNTSLVVVQVNREVTRFPLAAIARVNVQAGQGNDQVRIEGSAPTYAFSRSTATWSSAMR